MFQSDMFSGFYLSGSTTQEFYVFPKISSYSFIVSRSHVSSPVDSLNSAGFSPNLIEAILVPA